ncbi:MAG: NAD-dependent epimerase/dehydratase family protein [Methylophilaceae bacterium]
MDKQRVGLVGATSLVGVCLLPLLARAGYRVTAFSRRVLPRDETGAEWRQLPPSPPVRPSPGDVGIEQWVCVAPIWVLPEHFAMLEACGACRVVALSSTSRFTKDDSSDPEEQAIALRLADAEARVQTWAASHGVEWIILRPTLIYGFGRDKNIAEIARFIRRFGFFPLFGKANGLRQPLHAQDVAGACVAALDAPDAANHVYNLSGFDAIAYRDMVARIFTALGRPVRLLPVPLLAFRFAVAILRHLPRYRNWSSAMAERMNRDLVFDHSAATRDFGFKPRPFALSAEDVSV